MPIHVPGARDRRNRRTQASKREVVAVLQLTAMVDMFTVLVVFLLQNYASTNQILPISDHVALPKATSTAQLTPSLVVVLSKTKLSFNGKDIVSFQELKNSDEWMIEPLKEKISAAINKIKQEDGSALENPSAVEGGVKIKPFEKLTLQADETIDFLTIKKVMFTVTEAGIKEINFAVIQIKEYPS